MTCSIMASVLILVLVLPCRVVLAQPVPVLVKGVDTVMVASAPIAGTVTAPEQRVPAGVQRWQLTLIRASLANPAVMLCLSLELSVDDGVSWPSVPMARTCTRGGALLTVPLGEPTMLFGTLSQPTNATTRLRATMSVTGGSEVVAVSVRVD